MINPDELDWTKGEGLIPAIVQDRTGMVRMLGYMNREALEATIASGFVTFFSRSKQRLWGKGETSGNRLRLIDLAADCDRDTLLIRVDPVGPTCHTGKTSCFVSAGPFFPSGLEAIVESRAAADPASSYTARLAGEGIKRMAQKVGEEGVEVALAALQGDREELIGEAADLAFHLTLLLQAKGLSWTDISAELERRHLKRSATASS
jgi:phosphoribosyl-ATP pyrophosphohydrolase/phosphoribosyl-AMP cyclohydrolase